MSNYPNILTPPSSNEDSPQPIFYNPSPTSTHYLENYHLPINLNVTASPELRILEQPIDKFRFRYKSEMTGTHGSLCGMSSDRQRKQTYPTIELVNWDKAALLRCSIYQISPDPSGKSKPDEFKPHAHRLVKKQGKEEVDDPHDAIITADDGYIYTFHSMGIIHTAKKNLLPELLKKKTKLLKESIARSEGKPRELNTKEEVEIKGLAEADSKSINLNIVCLRFDAFQVTNGILYPICPPVYSHGINNLKSALTGELKIVRMDHVSSPAKGGQEVFILVERVTKKNIRIRFYEVDDDDNVLWQDYGKFTDLDVHHQYAIVFRTPPYKDVNITNTVKVYIQLERPSDQATSDPKEFLYTSSIDNYRPGAKRARLSYGSSSFDSSMASDEVPVPINQLSIGSAAINSQMMLNDNLSVELDRALTNIDSDEFKKLFMEFGSDYQSVCIDAATNFAKKNRRLNTPAFIPRTTGIIIQDITLEEARRTKVALDELKNFIKTRPTNENKVIVMLKHYFHTEHRTNALHVSIKRNDYHSVMFLLKLIYAYKQTHLLNVRNEDSETPLSIAVSCNNADIVNNLILCNVDVSICDPYCNTIFHTAVNANCSTEIMERLVNLDTLKSLINRENCEGDTPLNVAIENGNINALKVLIRGGADVNQKHKKNGYTPLRLAMEKNEVEMTRFILNNSETDPEIEDFQGINPLQVALKRESDDQEMMAVVSDYMKNNDYNEIVAIKNEIDEDMEDEEMEEKFSVKLERVSSDELKEMYTKVKAFTPQCLDHLAEILDRSGKWEDLAELLDLGHLMRKGFNDLRKSPTKTLLRIAIETNGDTVLEIRDFLENLDETQAVDLIDNMVKSYTLV